MIHSNQVPQPDYTRLLKAIRRQGDPNHVPLLELFADPEIISAVLQEPAPSWVDQDDDPIARLRGVDQRIRFWHQLGYGAFWEGPSLLFPGVLQLSTDDTANKTRAQRRWVDESAGPITSWEDFDRYPWPQPDGFDFSTMEYAARHMPEGMAMIGRGGGVLETAMFLMGYETLALALYDQPDLVAAVFDRCGEILLAAARSVVQVDRVMALWTGDDMGYKTGPMIAPKHLRQFAIPFHRQMAEIAHQQGMPYLLHSCGKLDTIMEDLIDAGIDGRHSFEDVIEPVESFYGRFGSRIAVIGGVDVDLLARGTPEQVRARTRHILEACAPSGAYILGSGNSIVNYMPPENFLAMVDEGKCFNR